MTREECIDWLCRLRSNIYFMPIKWRKKMEEALSKAIGALSEKKEPVDIGYLFDWYIHSVCSDDEPVWTEEHIEELDKDFWLYPKPKKGNHGTCE